MVEGERGCPSPNVRPYEQEDAPDGDRSCRGTVAAVVTGRNRRARVGCVAAGMGALKNEHALAGSAAGGGGAGGGSPEPGRSEARSRVSRGSSQWCLVGTQPPPATTATTTPLGRARARTQVWDSSSVAWPHEPCQAPGEWKRGGRTPPHPGRMRAGGVSARRHVPCAAFGRENVMVAGWFALSHPPPPPPDAGGQTSRRESRVGDCPLYCSIRAMHQTRSQGCARRAAGPT